MKSLLLTGSFLAFLLLISSCHSDWDPECRMSTQCPEPLFCQMGRCTDLGADAPQRGEDPLTTNHPASEADSDAYFVHDTDPQDAEPEEPHPCPDSPAATSENLVLNELFAYVPTGPEGDANGDGVRHAHDDEFVELVNTSEEQVDLTGVAIYNDTTRRFTFHPTCLDPLHAVVVFGGIEPGADLPDGEGWRSYIADSRFAYANGAGRAVVKAADDTIIADFSYGSHPAESLNLATDLTGDTYVAHGQLTDDAIFSPGTCANGQPFTSGCVDDDADDDNN